MSRIHIESRFILPGSGRNGEWGVIENGCSVSFGSGRDVLKLEKGDGWPAVNMLKNTEFYTLISIFYENWIMLNLTKILVPESLALPFKILWYWQLFILSIPKILHLQHTRTFLIILLLGIYEIMHILFTIQ